MKNKKAKFHKILITSNDNTLTFHRLKDCSHYMDKIKGTKDESKVLSLLLDPETIYLRDKLRRGN